MPTCRTLLHTPYREQTMPPRPAALPRLRLDRETVRRLSEQGSRDCSVPLPTEPVNSRYNLCQATQEC